MRPIYYLDDYDKNNQRLNQTVEIKDLYNFPPGVDVKIILTSTQMLIGYNGKLYELYPDLYVGEIIQPQYEAIGFNGSYAMGALYALESIDMSIEKKMLIAMSSVRKFAVTICDPYKIVSI